MERKVSFGQWLRQHRRKMDLTQEELADTIGCSKGAIQKIEAGGRRPSRQLAELLIEILGATPEQRPALLQLARTGTGANVPDLKSLSDSQTSTNGTIPDSIVPNVVASSVPSSAQTSRHPPTNLPYQLTSFIGRERDIDKALSLLWRTNTRMLTLTGPGGVGKSRLALQLATQILDNFADGVFFVPLASVAEPAMVAATIAKVVGVRETGSQPVEEALQDTLQEKQIFLVLDNFEHLTGAAPLLARFISVSPQSKLLITSRASLKISGERQLEVLPFALPSVRRPSLGELTKLDAVRLFEARAQATNPYFAVTEANAGTIAEICRRVDGLPLAIELAAARVKLLSPQEMLQRLESRLKLLTGGTSDMPLRQQTLRNTIQWSYELLNEDEKRLLRRLSVFTGGFTLQAVEFVCNNDGDLKADALDSLESLIDKSLLRQEESERGEPRLWMLETIREFATEQLQNTDEIVQVRSRHLHWYLQLAEQAELELRGDDQNPWLEQLDTEYDNLRGALQWTCELPMVDRELGPPRVSENGEHRARRREEEVVLGLRLATALVDYWEARGYLTEGGRWLGELLAVQETSHEGDFSTLPAYSTHPTPPALRQRAAAFLAAGRLAFAQRNLKGAAQLLEQSLILYRQLEREHDKVDPHISDVLSRLGIIACHQGQFAQAAGFFEESLALGRRLGDDEIISRSLSGLAWAVALQGDGARAGQLAQASLQLYRELGDMRGISDALEVLTYGARDEGDIIRARSLIEENTALLQRQGASLDTEVRGRLERLAVFWARHFGEYAQAAALLEAAIALGLRTGDEWSAAHLRILLAMVAREQGEYKRAEALLEDSREALQEAGDAYGFGRAIIGLADVARDQGDTSRAIAYSIESLALFRDLGDPAFICFSLHNLGVAECQRGNYVRAEVLFKEALAQTWPGTADKAEVMASIGHLALRQGDYVRSQEAFAESLRIGGGTGGWRWLIATNLEGLGEAAVDLAIEKKHAEKMKQAEKAIHLFSASDSVRRAAGTPMRPIYQASYDRSKDCARSWLGEEAFMRAWEKGQTMKIEQAIADALGGHSW